MKNEYYILLIILFLTSCKQEPTCGDLSDVVTTYTISDSDKAKIPYTGNDTLVYISDAGDTAILIGQGKKNYYESVRSSLNSGDCPRYKLDNNEIIAILYSSNINELLNIKYILNGNSEKTHLICTINSLSHGDYPYYLNNEIFYNDSFMLNNKLYYGTTINIQNSIFGLFNWHYGFVKIKIIGGKEWYLKI